MSDIILNLTIRSLSQEQIDLGIVSLTGPKLIKLCEYHTFIEPPGEFLIHSSAKGIVSLAEEFFKENDLPIGKVVIGGAPYLISELERRLFSIGATPYYNFSRKVVNRITSLENLSSKESKFKHIALIPVIRPNIKNLLDSINTLSISYDEYAEVLDKALDSWIDTDPFRTVLYGELSSNTKIVKSQIKKYYLDRWIADNKLI